MPRLLSCESLFEVCVQISQLLFWLDDGLSMIRVKNYSGRAITGVLKSLVLVVDGMATGGLIWPGKQS